MVVFCFMLFFERLLAIQRQMRTMSSSKLSAMLYRDSKVQKHQDRLSLEKELQEKTSKPIAPSKAKMKAIATTDSAPAVEVLLKHLIKSFLEIGNELNQTTNRNCEWLL